MVPVADRIVRSLTWIGLSREVTHSFRINVEGELREQTANPDPGP